MKKILAGVRWLYRPVNALPIFWAAGFLLPSDAAWSTFFYIVGGPTAFLGLMRGWRPDLANRPAVALLALWGWSSLAILWEHAPHGDGYFYWLLSSVSTLSLLLCFFMSMQAEPATRERVVSTIIWCAAAATTFSICVYVFNGKDGHRLGGWNTLHLAVLGAAVVVVCIFLTLGRIAQGQRFYLVALVPMLVYMPLNGSRTALLALLCGVIVLATNNRKVFLALLLVLLGGAALVVGDIAFGPRFGWLATYIKAAMARGSDCHVTIWRTAWDLFLKHPVLGYGPSMRLPIAPHGYCPAYPGPHSLYLSLLLFSGLVGFVLFGLCEVLAAQRLLRLRIGMQRRVGLAVMLVPLITGLTDINDIIKGPSPVWYIIWLPLLLVVSLPDAAPGLFRRSVTSFGSPPHG